MVTEVIALSAAISYALFTLSGWYGLQYANARVATMVSLTSRTITLWAAVYLTGGIPGVASSALAVFLVLGIMQTATSLLTFLGLQKIGTARSQPLRNSYPLWSAFIAIVFLDESAGLLVLAGTVLVVVGIVIISWKPDVLTPNYRWWHVFYSLGAGLLAGIAFPLRRYGLTMANEPVFFAAFIAVISLVCSTPYLYITQKNHQPSWHPKGTVHFAASGFFEGMGALLSLMALGSGRVVIVAPIVATTPLWNLLIAALFLRGKDELNFRAIGGTIAVVAGTVAIALGR
ncbi:MAG: EamA family transporter [Deltaproteobacteria bacterium]|nr:EamA family transporter [Deltaproteobacteria bacterium]